MTEESRTAFQDLLIQAMQAGASDLHISVRSPAILRMNGSLRPIGETLFTPDDTREFARSCMQDWQYERFMEEGELDFAFGIPGVSRFRINAYQQRGTVSIAARVIPSKIPSLEELQMPSVLQKLANKPQGLVLVTGPTGSGKSTTLAAVIDYINRNERKHIITLEDPIEYLHKHNRCVVDQREIGLDTRTFSSALRAALRQDPDVILVGEMRDPETISTAITAAETGHLVLATLHTVDAPQTIDRIIDSFPPGQQSQVRIQLASVLAGVISQRLLPRKDGKGRVAATEVLLNNAAVGNLIRTEKVHQIRSVMQTSMLQGMHTLEMCMRDLLRQNVVDASVVKPYLPEGNA